MGKELISGGTLTVLVLAGSYVLLFAAGLLFPLRESTRRLGPRLFTNAGMTAMTFAAGGLLVRPAALSVSDWSTGTSFGLLQWTALPAPVELAAGFLLMDLTFYYWHRANHVVPILWRFHAAHHIDPDLDVTTGFRFHFGEVAYSTGFRVAQVAVIGVSPLLYGLYELVFQVATLFHHANLRLPLALERVLNKVIVTPRMHGIHHSKVRRETNSNYSTVFRWWDWLHRTLWLCVPQSKIRIGVPNYGQADNRLDRALLMPFVPQKTDWKKAARGGGRKEEEPAQPGRLAE